jgi:aminoglycoside 2'-N-acetyltransferase I
MRQPQASPDTTRPANLPVRIVQTSELDVTQLAVLRQMLQRAYDNDFTDHDWQHACGGTHLLLELGPDMLAHAAVVPRRITFDDRVVRAGYVEAVAVDPAYQGCGLGTIIMTTAAEHIDAQFELGVLSTGSTSFYERLGWIVWSGPSIVRRADGVFRSRDDDGGIMVRLNPASPVIPLTATIGCDDRPGDTW